MNDELESNMSRATIFHINPDNVGECTADECDRLVEYLNEHGHRLDFLDREGLPVDVTPLFRCGDSGQDSHGIQVSPHSWQDALNCCFNQDFVSRPGLEELP